MKKILSLILALLMIVSCASVIFADDAVTAAAPASEADSAYYDAVKFLVNYDIMHGKGDTLGVYDDIKRYEMALFIGRICTGWVDDAAWEDGPENTSKFIDLAGTAAENYYGAISYVANKGIIEGVGGNRFAPEAGIKYEDALTMAVRALGYTGLAYPWGYIEKADDLGLTAGIKGVAYTETLKREVVAQIIFNALFAEKADGETLGLKNFGITNDYQIAIITATDGGIFCGGETKAAEGYVKYAIVGETGKLGSARYFASAATFGLEGEHADELALGAAFKVVLDADGKILSAESCALDPVVNAGVNSKEAGKYPIQAFLGEVALIGYIDFNAAERSGNFMMCRDDNGATIALNELWGVDWYTGDILKKNGADEYGVEWFYNQLLDVYFQYKFNADGKVVGVEYLSKADAFQKINVNETYVREYTDCYDIVADAKTIKTTAYAKLSLFDTNGDGEADYGMYDAYRLGKTNTSFPILDTSALVVGDTLEQCQGYFPNKPECWYPKFTKASLKYINEGIDIEDYSLVPNGGEPFGTFPFKSHETVNVKGCKEGWVSFQNGGASDEGDIVYLGLSADAIWTSDGQPLVDGEWVIYGTQPSTNEVTIVERLGEYEEGKETYVATGVLRAYSTAKKTVTIGDQVFSTSYDELTGSTFTSEFYRDGVWYMGSEYLAKLFNQYVTYVVVDEKVVYVEACGAEELRFFIVDGFAGIDKEGYIVIDAWDTADGSHKQVRIDSCDNWKFGDMFYYAENYTDYSNLFTANTYLQILSYNKETNSYGVTKAAIFDKINGQNQTGFRFTNADRTATDFSGEQRITLGNLDAIWFYIDYRFCKANIQFYLYQGKKRPAPLSWGDGADAWTAAGGDSIPGSTNGVTANMQEEKFVFIFAPGEVAGSPVRFWEGKVADSDWSVQGFRLVGTDPHTHIFVGLRAGNVNGFGITDEAASHTLVMIPDYKDKNGRGENGANDLGSWYLPDLGMISGWQIQWGNSGEYFTNANQHPWGYTISATYGQDEENLLGNTQYDVVVLNLRTLHTETVHVSNKNMKANYIYECVDGQVVGGPHNAGELYELLLGTFGNNQCDLENDLTELYTTYYNLKDKKAAHEGANGDNWVHAGYTILGTNQWMTEKWLGTAYADFGNYTVHREWADAAVVAIYEGEDGHVELTPLGMGGNKNQSTGYYITKNSGYGEFPITTRTNKAGNPNNTVQKSLTGSDDQDVDVVAVTVVNLDNAKLQRNLDPYGSGLAMITWLFDQRIVGTINHAFDKVKAE